MLAKARRQRPQRLAIATRQTFDGGDVRAFSLHRQYQAGPDRGAIDNDGARPAYPVFAADVGAGQLEMMAEGIGQGGARLHIDTRWLAVDGELGRLLRHQADSASFTPAARPKARSSSTPSK